MSESQLLEQGMIITCLEADLAASRAEVERLRGLLKSLEWIEGNNWEIEDTCPRCHGEKRRHEPDCDLDAALKGENP